MRAQRAAPQPSRLKTKLASRQADVWLYRFRDDRSGEAGGKLLRQPDAVVGADPVLERASVRMPGELRVVRKTSI